MRKKKLLHLSFYRGTKEADILMGSFAKTHVPGMNHREMDMWEKILQTEDDIIYRWLVLNMPIPESCNNVIGNKLKAFVENRWVE